MSDVQPRSTRSHVYQTICLRFLCSKWQTFDVPDPSENQPYMGGVLVLFKENSSNTENNDRETIHSYLLRTFWAMYEQEEIYNFEGTRRRLVIIEEHLEIDNDCIAT
jgi:hypothetical protein